MIANKDLIPSAYVSKKTGINYLLGDTLRIVDGQTGQMISIPVELLHSFINETITVKEYMIDYSIDTNNKDTNRQGQNKGDII